MAISSISLLCFDASRKASLTRRHFHLPGERSDSDSSLIAAWARGRREKCCKRSRLNGSLLNLECVAPEPLRVSGGLVP